MLRSELDRRSSSTCAKIRSTPYPHQSSVAGAPDAGVLSRRCTMSNKAAGTNQPTSDARSNTSPLLPTRSFCIKYAMAATGVGTLPCNVCPRKRGQRSAGKQGRKRGGQEAGCARVITTTSLPAEPHRSPPRRCNTGGGVLSICCNASLSAAPNHHVGPERSATAAPIAPPPTSWQVRH